MIEKSNCFSHSYCDTAT